MNRKLFVSLLLLLWAALIFHFSSQTYQEQDLTPFLGGYLEGHEWLENGLSWISFNYAGNEVSVDSLGVSHFIEFFIRKGAHLSIFAVLGFLTVAAWRYFLNRKSFPFIGPLLFVLIYASGDEFHQSLTGDRTPLWQDVVIDTIGGCLGILMFRFVWRMKERYQHKR